LTGRPSPFSRQRGAEGLRLQTQLLLTFATAGATIETLLFPSIYVVPKVYFAELFPSRTGGSLPLEHRRCGTEMGT